MAFVRDRERRYGAAPAYSGFRGGPLGQAYNEAAFRHFLAVDRRRAARSMKSLLLVLVTVQPRGGQVATLPDETAAALFVALGASVREADFVGWYREGTVAAAVLPQAAKAPSDAARLVTERVVGTLKKRLSPDQLPHLRVRVVRLGGRARN